MACSLKFYTIDEPYVDYLAPSSPHLFRNARRDQGNSRKYVGIVLQVNGFNYFVPLSSYKPKHQKMKNGLDFLKIKDYAVLNLNCMIPVPDGAFHEVVFADEKDLRYRSLLQAEYRVVKQMSERIEKNALNLYKHKLENGVATKLAARCNDFAKLEELCKSY